MTSNHIVKLWFQRNSCTEERWFWHHHPRLRSQGVLIHSENASAPSFYSFFAISIICERCLLFAFIVWRNDISCLIRSIIYLLFFIMRHYCRAEPNKVPVLLFFAWRSTTSRGFGVISFAVWTCSSVTLGYRIHFRAKSPVSVWMCLFVALQFGLRLPALRYKRAELLKCAGSSPWRSQSELGDKDSLPLSGGYKVWRSSGLGLNCGVCQPLPPSFGTVTQIRNGLLGSAVKRSLLTGGRILQRYIFFTSSRRLTAAPACSSVSPTTEKPPPLDMAGAENNLAWASGFATKRRKKRATPLVGWVLRL